QRIRLVVRQHPHHHLDRWLAEILCWEKHDREHCRVAKAANNSARKRFPSSKPNVSIRALSQLPSRDATETRRISDLSPNRPAPYGGDIHPIATMLASCNRGRSAEK